MFGLGDQMGDFRAASYQLDVYLPIDLFIIDLGGGFKGTPKGQKVKPAQVASAPMRAVLKGMLDKRIPRFGARPMDMRGLFSVMMRHATTSPEEQSSFQAPCYALISDCYANYSARVGYHFSVLDAYCSPTPNKNYINLLFRGGAADNLRRSRRTRAIANILKHYGFVHDTQRRRGDRAAEQGQPGGDHGPAGDDRPPAAVLPADGCRHGDRRSRPDDRERVPHGRLCAERDDR